MANFAATCPKCNSVVLLDETKGVRCECGHGPFILSKTDKGITVYCLKV